MTLRRPAERTPPYSTVYWHYKQWRDTGIIKVLMQALHEQVREQVKKAQMDSLDHYDKAWRSINV